MIGRYLMHLSPIMLVTGVLVLERIAETKLPFRLIKALISIGALIGFASVAWWIILNNGIWPLSNWNVSHVVNSIDVTAFGSPLVFFSVMVVVLLLPVIIFFRRNDIRLPVLLMVAFMLVGLGVDAGRVHARQNGLHYRHMAHAVANLNEQGNILNVFTDNKDLSLLLSQHFRGKDWVMRLNQRRLAFWGVDLKQILIHDFSTLVGFPFTSIKSPALLITNTLFNIKPEREYLVNGTAYYIYRVDGLDSNVLQPVRKDGK